MEAAIRQLIDRLDALSDQYRELREGILRAVHIADDDPEMALIRSRKVLEYLVRDVFSRRVGEPPGTRPLENLVQRLVKDGHFPPRLEAYAETIRKLGNVGAHHFDQRVSAADVYQSLTQLMPILEWYFEAEHPDAGVRLDVPPPREPEKPAPPQAGPEVHAPVVPKGLRSFDANDSGFFLQLLPGPRDRDGLPESLRFWKHRIEAADDPAFTVGVIYGPSGCGKSSLVKAGLLPRLARHVIPIYVEATPDETEARLLNGLRRKLPALPDDLDLAQTVVALRQGHGLRADQKVVLVVDQFEQWLHAHRAEPDPALAQALRQCDGDRVQCVLLVRDDFWVSLTRFMGDLGIEILQGQNTALVDLFDPIHARKVLAEFGRAYGRLPALPASPSKDQDAFLSSCVEGLIQEGRVVPIRLALFAEMVKGKPWAPVTLRQVGGTEGVGVTFLEEAFGSAALRTHRKAAQALLRALLPQSGSDIKGHMRSPEDLLTASDLTGRPERFAGLLRILDGELRLITPSDPEEASNGDPATERPGRYYQLTHDFLVHPIREWIRQAQRGSRRGRATLLLESRTQEWTARPSQRFLPSVLETFRIMAFTRRREWTESQRRMMKRAMISAPLSLAFNIPVIIYSVISISAFVIGGWWLVTGSLWRGGDEEKLRDARRQASYVALQLEITPVRYNFRVSLDVRRLENVHKQAAAALNTDELVKFDYGDIVDDVFRLNEKVQIFENMMNYEVRGERAAGPVADSDPAVRAWRPVAHALLYRFAEDPSRAGEVVGHLSVCPSCELDGLLEQLGLSDALRWAMAEEDDREREYRESREAGGRAGFAKGRSEQGKSARVGFDRNRSARRSMFVSASWSALRSQGYEAAKLLRVASAVSLFDPEHPDWPVISRRVALALGSVKHGEAFAWARRFRPVRRHLIPHLEALSLGSGDAEPRRSARYILDEWKRPVESAAPTSTAPDSPARP